MHSVCYLAVTADSDMEAIDAAVEFLDPYHGGVFDYYSVGGRWSGAFDGSDTVNSATQRRCFLDAVDRGQAWMTETYHRARQELAGPDPRHPVECYFGDVDETQYEAIVERTWAGWRTSSAQFAALLDGTSMPGRVDPLLAYRIRRFSDLVGGQFSTDCAIYDAAERTWDVQRLLERVDRDPARQWLVVLDLHS